MTKGSVPMRSDKVLYVVERDRAFVVPSGSLRDPPGSKMKKKLKFIFFSNF